MLYPHEAPEDLSQEEVVRLLTRTRHGRLGLAFENEAYVVPISYIYDGHSIYFHITRQGKKTTYLQANPQACFEIDEVAEGGWASVICYGAVTLSDSVESKREFLRLAGVESPGDDALGQMEMYICVLSPDEMTGRRSASYVV